MHRRTKTPVSQTSCGDDPLDDLQSHLRRGRLRGLPGPRIDQTAKALAKRLAQDTAATVEDRKIRAQVRAACYNQLITLLRLVIRAQSADREWYWRVTLVAAFGLSLLSAVLTWRLVS